MKDLPDDMPDDSLRRKLQNYAEEPDPDIFQKIDAGIKKQLSVREKLHYYHDHVDESVWTGVQSRLVLNDFLQWLDWTARVFAVMSLFLMTSVAFEGNNLSQQSFITSKNGGRSPKEGSSFPKTFDLDGTFSENNQSEKQPGQLSISDMVKQRTSLGGPGEMSLSTQHGVTAHEFDTPPADRIVVARKQALGDSLNTFARQSEIEDIYNDSITPVSAKFSENIIGDEAASEKDEKDKKAHKPKGIYMLVMPTFGYQHIAPVENDNILIESIQKVSAFSTKRLGIRLEAGIEKELTKRISWNIGILYFQRKQSITYVYKDTEDFTVERLSADSLSYQIHLPNHTGTFEYELKNVGIVTGINYALQGKRINQKAGVAIELQKGLNRPDHELMPGNSTYLFGNAYYQLSYPLSGRFDIMIQPTLNYALKIDSRINAPFYVKPYGLGLNFGGFFHF